MAHYRVTDVHGRYQGGEFYTYEAAQAWRRQKVWNGCVVETDRYGRTFEEWLAAARCPDPAIVLSELRAAWRQGVDPCEYALHFATERLSEKLSLSAR